MSFTLIMTFLVMKKYDTVKRIVKLSWNVLIVNSLIAFLRSVLVLKNKILNRTSIQTFSHNKIGAERSQASSFHDRMISQKWKIKSHFFERGWQISNWHSNVIPERNWAILWYNFQNKRINKDVHKQFTLNQLQDGFSI